MSRFITSMWISIVSIGGISLMFLYTAKDMKFDEIRSLSLSPTNEQNDMELVEYRVNEFLQHRNDSKFVTLTLSSCGGLCNMFYRYLSVYGIGRSIGRQPFIDGRVACFRRTMHEFEYALPNLHNAIRFIKPSKKRTVSFGMECCKLDNVTNTGSKEAVFRLKNIDNDQFLYIKGTLLQAFGYFHQYKDEIRYLLEFSDKIKTEVDEYAKKLYGDDSSHKFCVHTRVGDFKEHFLLESIHNFTDPSIQFIARYLKEANKRISLVLLGLDTSFNYEIPIPRHTFDKVYIPSPLNRTSDLYFGSRYCDSLLMTASGSTFAWWTGYLMPEHKQSNIFYNIRTAKRTTFGKTLYDYDSFPKEWKRLRLTSNGSIVFEAKWNFELKGSAENYLLNE